MILSNINTLWTMVYIVALLHNTAYRHLAPSEGYPGGPPVPDPAPSRPGGGSPSVSHSLVAIHIPPVSRFLQKGLSHQFYLWVAILCTRFKRRIFGMVFDCVSFQGVSVIYSNTLSYARVLYMQQIYSFIYSDITICEVTL